MIALILLGILKFVKCLTVKVKRFRFYLKFKVKQLVATASWVVAKGDQENFVFDLAPELPMLN